MNTFVATVISSTGAQSLSEIVNPANAAGKLRAYSLLFGGIVLSSSIRLGYCIHLHLHESALFTGTSRSHVSYWTFWEIIFTGTLWLVGLAVWLTMRADLAVVPSIAAMYIQCLVTLCIYAYAEANQLGTLYALLTFPLIGFFFQIHQGAVVIGYLFSTTFVMCILLSKSYFPAFLLFQPNYVGWHTALFYLMASVVPLGVPLLKRTHSELQEKLQHETCAVVAEVMDLLSSLDADQALAVIREKEHAGCRPSELGSLEKLATALSHVRSYLPGSLLVQTTTDDAFGEDDDEAVDQVDSDQGDHLTDGSRSSMAGLEFTASARYLAARRGGQLNDPDDDDEFDVAAQGEGVRQFQEDKYYLRERTVFRRRWSTLLLVRTFNHLPDSGSIERIAAKVCEAAIPRIVERRGVIESISPQAVLGSFNCHTPCVIHETEACHCALAIAAELSQHPELKFCIVVASGYNFVGSCGVESHRAKVVIGDSIELIYTLPSLAGPILGSRIIISEDTANKVGLETAPIDFVLPRKNGANAGKPITLFELRSSRKDNALSALSSIFSNAFAVFRSGQPQKSLPLWQNYIARAPTDYQARRLAELAAHTKDGLPYVRKEIQWAVEGHELEFRCRDSKNNSMSDSIAKNRSAGSTTVDPAGSSVTRVAATVRQHLATEKLDLQEDGLFEMYLPEDDDAPKETVVVEEEAVSTQVPHAFEDAMAHTWRRSEQQIGFGAFSTVYLALSNQGDLSAMKCFNLTKRSTSREELVQEVDTLSRLRHDHIVGYVTYAVTTNHFVILMEYVSGGSLLQILGQFGPLPVPAAKRYLIDILKGLRYLHEHGITHCDIKPHNVLLGNDGTCKLSDFGSSVNSVQAVRGDGQGNGDDDVLLRGTSWYLAPEAARGSVLAANDIWSVGVTFLEMITGKQPWTWKGSEAQFIVALGKDETMVPPIGTAVPEEAAAFVRLCCNRDATKRPGADQLLQSPFLCVEVAP